MTTKTIARADLPARASKTLTDALDHSSSKIEELTEAAIALRTGQFDAAFDATSASQDAYYKHRAALASVTLPPELIVPSRERRLVSFEMAYSDGTREVRNPELEMVCLESAEAITAYCNGDSETAERLVAALAPWLNTVTPLRHNLAKAEAVMRRNETRQVAMQKRMLRAALAILDVPATTPAEILAKAEGFSRAMCGSGNVEDLESFEDYAPLLEAMIRDLQRLAWSAEGAIIGREAIGRVWDAARVAQSAPHLAAAE